VSLAKSGEAALQVIERGVVPDIVLLDIAMPGLDGYETLEKLRKNPDTEDVPVIFLTGRTGVRDQVRGLSSGVADYITKPFEKDVLLARLRLHLKAGMERRRLRLARKNGTVVELDEEKFELLTKMLNNGEKEIARLIALGASNREIAANLTYSLDAVKKMTTQIYNKTGLSDRYELRKYLIGNQN
jgi:DNA-binding response OmpR family regulator